MQTAGVDIRTPGSLRRTAVPLEYFTVVWTFIEAVVALVAGGMASSVAMVGFGLDSAIEVISGLALLWRFKQRRLEEHEAESRAVRIIGFDFLHSGDLHRL